MTIKSSRAIDKVEVFNVLGQGIICKDGQNTIQNIDISNVQVGVYIIRIYIENQTNTIRVIKQ
ncbi:T9SS type A sorting domain-containing protein [Psychroserpens luteus]|uniref:T9SS type A sorting domain-containing protein n=1 Tax=Psychroserpens luteus TaxID=1434066 RepID=A0ABW6A0G3_9FLAO